MLDLGILEPLGLLLPSLLALSRETGVWQEAQLPQERQEAQLPQERQDLLFKELPAKELSVQELPVLEEPLVLLDQANLQEEPMLKLTNLLSRKLLMRREDWGQQKNLDIHDFNDIMIEKKMQQEEIFGKKKKLYKRRKQQVNFRDK